MASKPAATSSASSVAPKDVERDIKRLAQRVVRSFYGDMQAVLIDTLVRKEPAVRDDIIASRLGAVTKDVGKIAQPLLDSGIIRSHIRNELREQHARVTPRVWYYLDLRHFVDVVKWRMYTIRSSFESKNKDEISAQGYICPLCKRAYSTLDIAHCLDPTTGSFICEICGTELEDNDSVSEIAASRDQVKRFLEQCKHIVETLQKTEDMIVPALDIIKWLQTNYPLDEKGAYITDGSAPIAGPSQVGAKTEVELITDADVEARKRKADEEELAKREANLAPTWFQQSTVAAARQPSPLADVKPEAVRLEDEPDYDEDEGLFGQSPAASTPATSLGASGAFSNEDLTSMVYPTKASGKRSRDEMEEDAYDSDGAASAASVGKKVKIQPPSSPVIAEEWPEVSVETAKVDVDDEADDDFDFEAVDEDPLVSCGGEMIRASVIAQDLVAYQKKMTSDEWTAYLSI